MAAIAPAPLYSMLILVVAITVAITNWSDKLNKQKIFRIPMVLTIGICGSFLTQSIFIVVFAAEQLFYGNGKPYDSHCLVVPVHLMLYIILVSAQIASFTIANAREAVCSPSM